MYTKLGSGLISVLLVAGLATSSLASGFAIIEQSVSGLGTAFANGAATAEDASAMYFNPATMTLIKGQQVVSALHVIVPSAKFSKESAVNRNGVPISGDGGGDGGVTGLVPNLYYTYNTDKGLAFGVGINAPFGLTTDYGREWVGRYHAVESAVKTININPAVAYQLTDKLGIGVGINVQYIEATLSSMVDATGAANTAQDVFVENEADDWSFGFNLGLTYQLSAATRLGASYRSEIKHELEGNTRTEVPTALVGAIGPFFQDQGVNGKIDLPASASLSINHQVNEKLTLLGDVSWTGWSSFQELTFNFEGDGIGGKPSTTTVENWDDSWRYSVGAIYQLNEALKLRGGLAFDQTPISSDEYRTPRIPGEDRTWLTVGVGYQFTDMIGVDFGYAHLFVADARINKSDNATSEGSLVGDYDSSVDIFSAQLVMSF